MTQQDVDLVRRLNLQPDVDLAAVLRDEELTRGMQAVLAPFLDPAFECAMVGVSETWLPGFEGLRQIWLDWMEPWETYRTEEEETVDLGDGRVLYLGRDFGGTGGGSGEVVLRASAIWTVRDGRIAKIVFYANRSDALAAAGRG